MRLSKSIFGCTNLSSPVVMPIQLTLRKEQLQLDLAPISILRPAAALLLGLS
jgi:hypothetical protein